MTSVMASLLRSMPPSVAISASRSWGGRRSKAELSVRTLPPSAPPDPA